ncbi:hypothetical protein LZK77_31875 (plasmid) [Rhizobium leguminosarum]|jgi:hypothetical protein|nr:hypothetical protein LZK77_31875 [Rhizobium leguminosarum]UIY26843.1 hypothetical protein LZK76_31465 [Rhizobium leguminosarum]
MKRSDQDMTGEPPGHDDVASLEQPVAKPRERNTRHNEGQTNLGGQLCGMFKRLVLYLVAANIERICFYGR